MRRRKRDACAPSSKEDAGISLRESCLYTRASERRLRRKACAAFGTLRGWLLNLPPQSELKKEPVSDPHHDAGSH
eukprot:3363589-Rhodomonas_salina.4